MSPAPLESPILGGGIRSVSFFNGRLLSAEDLKQEQAARDEQRARLGRAHGDGVAWGLEVAETRGVSTPGQPVVTVQPGMAVNRNGQVLTLPSPVDVTLVQPVNAPRAVGGSAGFRACDPLHSGVYLPGVGVYVLVMSPAGAAEGRAPVSGLGNLAATCNTRYNVEGIQFRLIRLIEDPTELADTARLRSWVALRCFGLDDPRRTAFSRDPFGPPVERYGLLDDLRPNRLTDWDVPLAVLHWVERLGIQFIDLWSVRRRVARPAMDGRWNVLLAERRAAEAEAMFFQFQDHIEYLIASRADSTSIVVNDHFHYLPPVGVLQLAVDAGAAPTAPQRGLDFRKFFGIRFEPPLRDHQVYRSPTYIEGARVEAVVRQALPYPPVRVPPVRAGLQSMPQALWLYWIRENVQAAAAPGYLIFTSGHLPRQSESRLDVARWDFGYVSDLE